VHLVVLTAAALVQLVGEPDRGRGDIHQVVLAGERLDDGAEALEPAVGLPRDDRLADRDAGQVQSPGLHVEGRRHGLDRDLPPREVLDVPHEPVLARLGQRDRDALAAGAAGAADAVDVRLG
jgi:hypothetical protein